MAKYAAAFSQAALTTTYKTAGNLRAPATSMRRIKLYDILFGSGGTPADNVLQFDVSRTSANGTDTSVTPLQLDPADAASAATFGSNASAEPTVTASTSLINFNLNQRASYRWVSAPGSELVIPATANAGLAVRGLSPAYTGAAGGEALFEEQ